MSSDIADIADFPATPPREGAIVAPPARLLRLLGLTNIAFGAAFPLVNGIVVGIGISKLRELHVSGAAMAPLWIALAMYMATGLVFALGGIGLCDHKLWGRWLALVGAALLFASVLVTFFGVNLAWERAKLEYQGPLIELSISGGVPILWPAYGAVLLVLLNTPNVQRWARDAKGVEANAEPPLSRLATVSIALSLSPFAIIPQALALITGIIALLRIGRSQGALAGAGFALGGIVFSFVIIVASIAWHLVSPIGVYYTSYVVAPAVGLVAFPWICFVGRR